MRNTWRSVPRARRARQNICGAEVIASSRATSAPAAWHRALACRNPWFRFDGKRWLVRSSEDVEKDMAKLAEQERRALERSSFVAAAAARLRGDDVELPEGSAKFLRVLRDVAVEGESSSSRKEGGQLVAEIRGGTAAGWKSSPPRRRSFCRRSARGSSTSAS